MSSGSADPGDESAETTVASSSAAALQALAVSTKGAGKGGTVLSSVNGAIDSLREEQQRVRDERKRLAKELKNAQRRKKRLKGRARALSNEDLLAVLLMREERAAASASGSAASSGAGSSTDPAPGGAGAGSSSDIA